jgi:hypothetical protein
MAWTKKQKQLAVMACRAAGISDEQRTDLVLRNFQNAHYKGDITSTSPKLTNHDFEAFMAVVERFAGGRILHFTLGFWERAAADWLSRMRFKAQQLAAVLEAAGKLAPGGIGLAGWIQKRVSAGAARRVEELEYHGLLALILGLEAYARQNAVALTQT